MGWFCENRPVIIDEFRITRDWTDGRTDGGTIVRMETILTIASVITFNCNDLCEREERENKTKNNWNWNCLAMDGWTDGWLQLWEIFMRIIELLRFILSVL